MKSFVALLAVVAVVAADVSHVVRNPEADAQIVKQAADVFSDQYSFGYETSNGIAGQESGVLKNAGSDTASISVQGSNQYTAPNGEKISITYEADENGYRPVGAHLPTPPAPLPLPEHVLRAIEYIRTHPYQPEPGQKY